MPSTNVLLGKVAGSALAALLLLLAAPANAQSLSIRFSGSVSGCSDTSLNQLVSFNFGATGQASGADTLITIDFGGSQGSVSIPIPTAELEAIAQAVSSAGGSIEAMIGPEPLGEPGCVVQGTLVISLGSGVDPGNASPSVLLNEKGASDAGRFATGLASIVRQRRSGSGNGAMRTAGGMVIQGKAAGSDGMALGAWAGYSRTSAENDFVTTAFKEHRHDFLVGIDSSINDDVLVGVAVGLQAGDTKTAFGGTSGEQNLTAITVAPYVGVLLTDWLSLDGTIGYSDVQIDQYRTARGTGAIVSSDVDASRLFASLNLAASRSFGNLLLTGLGGMNYASQRDEAFVESNGARVAKRRSSVGRLVLGGEAALSVGAWEPYARALLEYDYTKTTVTFAPGVAAPKNDDTDVLAGIGVRYFGDNGVSGAIEYSSVLGRRNFDEDTLSTNVRWEF